jgi:uncharacterized membrane protein YfcA
MDLHFLEFVAVGFLAQVVDGALGMAYGVTSTTFLLTLGLPPAAASASVHAAEVFTTGASGLAHLTLGNVDRRLFLRLVGAGVAGAVAGAWLLTAIPATPVRLLVSLYLAAMGGLILRRALRGTPPAGPAGPLGLLGLAGGFCDALGGGGWGPLVASTLLARGTPPRFTVGSVNLAEFFVALAASATFLLTIGLGHWRIVLALVLGGMVAAPVAALLCRHLPPRPLMLLIGLLILSLSLRLALHGVAG